ncbi:MAG TPA: polymer-forming cytoskeletal protein [Geobacteraceae bacterium]|nr:polymer-forming cytoskeletal protein [Geobacteraceae bacterium]
MFGKKQPRIETLIGPDTTLHGELKTAGTVRIDGALEGNLAAEWVVIGEKGSILGDVVAKGMVVGGKVTGNIRSSHVVEIKQKGEVVGEIYTSNLIIMEGAVFEGHSYMQRSREIECRTLEPELVE